MIEDILKSRYGDFIDGLDIYENSTSLILSRIIIKPNVRQEGIGSKIMNELINYADKNKQIIALTPSNDFGGNKNRLVQFYKKFGFKQNKGHHKSYEFRDSMIRYPRTMNENTNKIKGGLADKMTKKDISDKFGLSLQKINKELEMGIKVEMEHANSKKLAQEIAMDHLVEIPDYYSRLTKLEKDGKAKWNIKESTKANIQRLFRENVELSVIDETPDTSTYIIQYNGRDAGQIVVSPSETMDKALEIVLIELSPDYNTFYMKIINEVIHTIFNDFELFQTILVTPTPESRAFWAKMGANRLNDTFMMIQRSH
jgi:hypothetical protein